MSVIHSQPMPALRCGVQEPECSEFSAMQALAAAVGRDPLLTQGTSGNASIKLDGTLWIKASGTWLADAQSGNVFVPIVLKQARSCLQQNSENLDFALDIDTPVGSLRPSVETAMHVVLPHKIVLHLHSVKVIAAAVRDDAPQMLAKCLAGLPWAWIDYVDSGQPLGAAVQNAYLQQHNAQIFILGNHGLVICGDDSSEVNSLLLEVESRLPLPARSAPSCDEAYLKAAANGSGWLLPESASIHALATDPVATSILAGGVLYPCQAIFLHGSAPWRCASVSVSRMERLGWPFVILKGRGVLLAKTISDVEYETLAGLGEVVSRIDSHCSVRYLTASEIPRCGEAYRAAAQSSCSAPFQRTAH